MMRDLVPGVSSMALVLRVSTRCAKNAKKASSVDPTREDKRQVCTPSLCILFSLTLTHIYIHVEDGKNAKTARVEQGETRSSSEDAASRTNGVNPPPLVPYGYPGSLQQYAQHLGAAAAYGYKEQVMSNPNSFVVGAVYPSSLEYPMVVPSNGDTQHKDQSTTGKDDKSANETEDKHATTAVPDASTSSGTSSPDSAQDEDATRFERLTQLCTAALKQNDNSSNNNNKKKVEGKSDD